MNATCSYQQPKCYTTSTKPAVKTDGKYKKKRKPGYLNYLQKYASVSLSCDTREENGREYRESKAVLCLQHTDRTLEDGSKSALSAQ